MNHSMPGLPVHHQLPEFTQTPIHRVSDAIQLSHPQSSPSPPAPNPSQHQSFPMSQLFAWGGQSTAVSALALFLPEKSQGYSSEWTGWISLQSKELLRVFSNTTIQKHQFFSTQLSLVGYNLQGSLLACVHAKSHLTLCNPMYCSLPGFSVHGFLQARILEWVSVSSSRGCSQPRDQTRVSYISCIGRQGLYP